MKKYIIRNCPALLPMTKICDAIKLDKRIPCKNCTDCLLKQIVKKCKEHPRVIDVPDTTAFVMKLAVKDFVEEILDLLQIEEV